MYILKEKNSVSVYKAQTKMIHNVYIHTHVLLKRSAPDSDSGGEKPVEVDTNVGYSTDGNASKN